MSQGCQGDSLSWGDAFFLYLEREGQPLNIAGVSEFEGVIPLEACIRYVESKLPLVPRYMQHVVAPPFNVGLPVWEFDPGFDISRHIRLVTVKKGTDADLKALAGKLVSARMDRDHPLWDFTLVHGLKGNRTGVIIRIHHSLADGIAGVGLINILMDPSPHPRKTAAKPRPPAELNRDPGAKLLDGLLKSYLSILQGAFAAHSEVLNLAQDVVLSAGRGMTADLIQLVPELGTPAERLPFNQVCRGPQKVAWAELPMADIKAIREVTGATVNDVVLAVITSAFRRYAELHGAHLKGKQLRVVVPVNVRGNGDVRQLGNQITFLPINVPLDMKNPRELLANVSQRMTFLRSAGVADFVKLAGGLISQIPLPLQAFLAPIASQLPLSVCNTIITNVPGPQIPLYLIGHKMLRWYPYVPIGGEMGINVAILSYDGVAYVGFSGDVHAAPDLERLEKFVDISFHELKVAATAKPPVEKTKHSKESGAVSSKKVTRKTKVKPIKPRRKVSRAMPKARVKAMSESPARGEVESEPELAQVGA